MINVAMLNVVVPIILKGANVIVKFDKKILHTVFNFCKKSEKITIYNPKVRDPLVLTSLVQLLLIIQTFVFITSYLNNCTEHSSSVSVSFTKCHHAECCHAECLLAECHIANECSHAECHRAECCGANYFQRC
jgi:hypothetical protein